jgi:UDP-arabinose 4-epimerase
MARDAVLVTGGAGYIGSHACLALAEAGYTPVVFDNFVYGHPWAVQWGESIAGDLTRPQDIETALERVQPAAVMHFAAYAYVGESVADPARYYRNNVQGSLELVEAMRRHGVTDLVFSSTCATYGRPESVPIPEDHPQRPINPYGTTKLTVERILGDYARAYGLNAVALRYFNAAGADPQARIGEAHDPETHLIPLVLDAAAGRRGSITVFGEDYATPDGTCIRDYIHVTDLADAHVRALGWLRTAPGFHAFNLGNGAGFSVLEVIEAARRVTGRSIPVETGDRRPGDPDRLVGDATAAREHLGWQPRYDALGTILETAWRWHRVYFG